MTTWEDRELCDLRWHWGGAYHFHHFPGIGLWLAIRLDTHETLKAGDPEQLRQAVCQDYRARRVPRDIAP